MQIYNYPPSDQMKKHIQSFFVIQSDEGNIPSSSPQLIFPDGMHGMFFILKGSVKRVSAFDSTNFQVFSNIHVFGQKTKAVYYQVDEADTYCFGFKLLPNALNHFAQIPAELLSSKVMDGQFLLGNDINSIHEQLRECVSLNQKVRLIEYFFRRILWQKQSQEELLVEAILEFIYQHRGQVKLSNIIQLFQLNYKRLERLFKKHIGLNPKAFCRIVRFNSILYYQQQYPTQNLTQLAYTAGYFDQMHFNKDVKHFTNLTPKAFLWDRQFNELNPQTELLMNSFDVKANSARGMTLGWRS